MNTNSNISIFNNDSFGELRVITREGKPWFVAAEVLRVLESSHSALRKLRDREKGWQSLPTLGGTQDVTVISESGFYRLVMRSDKPQAESFQDWVVEEVLPAIRKDGGYVHAREGDTEVEILARGMLAAKSAIERLESRVATLAPAAEKYDKYLEVGRNESIGTFAKTAQDSGIDVGVTELFEVLRFKRVLCSGKGVNWNQPYANYVKAGLMATKPVPPQKREEWRCTPLVTPKGKDYFLPRLPSWIEEYREYQKLGGEQNFLNN
jgi:Prophage antirepressor